MVTLLRTLTKKSPMKFGKYTDCTVQHLLNMNIEGKSLLAWYYYNLSKISFNQDVLNEIGITDWLVIDKPGKNPDMHKAWRDETMSLWQQSRLGKILKVNTQIRNFQRNKRTGFIFSKTFSQRRNQGKIIQDRTYKN